MREAIGEADFSPSTTQKRFHGLEPLAMAPDLESWLRARCSVSPDLPLRRQDGGEGGRGGRLSLTAMASDLESRPRAHCSASPICRRDDGEGGRGGRRRSRPWTRSPLVCVS
ncbi:hypothetical protein EUGRSUZ_L03769 [Eucalyptus grandis]|uniref:Uncharacterized protein n=1 Tax=Eucalyptus grandis TaxID=71139 RepID=A0AAD9T7H9_EUCGR|nr:hypothetical protein EUGRSUZ_L03769 [Eucalyptus grandis]